MDVDVSLIMTVITLATALIVGTDAWLFRSRERGQTPSLVWVARGVFPVLLIVWAVRSFIVEPYEIPSESMQPELLPGDFIAVNKWSYGIRVPILGKSIFPVDQPERGDVVVFRYPVHPSTIFIKRVIGVPGDEIRYDGGRLYLNERLVVVSLTEGGYLENLNGRVHPINIGDGLSAGNKWEVKVPQGHYFVMGDNRDKSQDSRFWGPVPDANLVGKASRIILHHGSQGMTLSRNGLIF